MYRVGELNDCVKYWCVYYLPVNNFLGWVYSRETKKEIRIGEIALCGLTPHKVLDK